MIDPRAKYQEALAAFATPGGRWANKGALTYWGKAAGLTADEIVADARAAGVTDRDADIRRGWADAKTRDAANMATYTARARKPSPPPPHAAHVRNLIVAGGGMGCSGSVRELSPCRDWFGKPPNVQTALFMRAAYLPDEVLHIFRDDMPTAGKPGVNMRTAADWIRAMESGEPMHGDLVVANPFTGKIGTNMVGKPSFIAKNCLAAFPFVVIEMDDARFAFGAQGDVTRGLQMQCAFWRAFILTSKLSPALVALTYSGGKSIHGLLNVGCLAMTDWELARDRLVALFATDHERVIGVDGKDRYPFRVDVQALEPRQGVRLPGVRRFDNRRLQTLLYLNPRARVGTMWRDSPPPAPPPSNTHTCADVIACH